MKKKIIGYSVLGLFIIILAVFSAFVLPLRYGPRIINLQRIDKDAYAICQKLLEHPLIKSKDMRFFVYYGSDLFPKNYDKINDYIGGTFERGEPNFDHIIIFPPTTIKSECFEVAAAHGLGHINLKTTDELAVDEFTVNILGQSRKKLIKHCLIKAGGALDSARIIALSDKEENVQ